MSSALGRRWLVVAGAFAVAILMSAFAIALGHARASSPVTTGPGASNGPGTQGGNATPCSITTARTRAATLGGLPTRWSGVATVRNTPAGIHVVTDPTLQYELESPQAILPAGSYQVKTTFRVLRGGIAVGVLSVGPPQRFLVEDGLNGRSGSRSVVASTNFQLQAPTPVAVVLSNTVKGSRSVWQIKSVVVTYTGCPDAN